MLEVDRLCGAKRYERSPERVDTRAGHYERQFQTQAGEVSLKMPKLRSLPFETAIIERYKRRETSVEALWGARVSASTVNELNQKVAGQIEAWGYQPIQGSTPMLSSTASG